MLTSVVARAIVAFDGSLSVNRNEPRPSTSAQSRSCTRTTFVVSPGAKVSVPVPRLTKSLERSTTLPALAVPPSSRCRSP